MICAHRGNNIYTVDEGHIRFVGEQFPGRRYNFKPTRTQLIGSTKTAELFPSDVAVVVVHNIIYTAHNIYKYNIIYNTQYLYTACARNYREDISIYYYYYNVHKNKRPTLLVFHFN